MHDTIYLVLRWEAWLGLLIVSALLTVGALFLLGQRKPEWRPVTRRVAAACVAPLLIFVGVGVGIAMVLREPGEGWADLASAAVVTAALQLSAVSLVVGLATAWTVDVLTSDRGPAR